MTTLNEWKAQEHIIDENAITTQTHIIDENAITARAYMNKLIVGEILVTTPHDVLNQAIEANRKDIYGEHGKYISDAIASLNGTFAPKTDFRFTSPTPECGIWQPLLNELNQAYLDTYPTGGIRGAIQSASETLRLHRKKDKALDYLMSIPEIDLDPIEEKESVPALPAACILPEHLGKGDDTATWLDAYVALSRKWSPRSYDGFHVAAGLWILSTIAARRVVFYDGKSHYTNLYLALLGASGLYAKSFCGDLAVEVIGEAGFGWLLVPEDITPQALIQLMSGHVPADYGELTGKAKVYAEKRLAFAGQKGWNYDEFSQLLNEMASKNNTNAAYHGILRRFDDTKPHYEKTTIGRGSDTVENPYLALFTEFTVTDMKTLPAGYWHSGFWGRFTLIAPPKGLAPSTVNSPKGKRIIPDEIIAPLQLWDRLLGAPTITIEQVKGEGERKFKWVKEQVSQFPACECTMTSEAYKAYKRYDDALTMILVTFPNDDLNSNYKRFPFTALRIAMLLASIGNGGAIELRHWARAQAIVETWRSDLHNVYEQVNDIDRFDPTKQDASKEDAIIDRLRKLHEKHGKDKAFTPRDIYKDSRILRKLPPRATEEMLNNLEKNGVVSKSADRYPRYNLTQK